MALRRKKANVLFSHDLLSNLPHELLNIIKSNLSLEDFGQFILISKYWRSLLFSLVNRLDVKDYYRKESQIESLYKFILRLSNLSFLRIKKQFYFKAFSTLTNLRCLVVEFAFNH